MDKKKVLEKKIAKIAKLHAAAYDLFTSIGVNNTKIDDIVRNAGVAKGTFYLYFKDKYDLVDKIILNKSTAVIKDAMKAVLDSQNEGQSDFFRGVIVFADYFIEYFKNNRKLLALIYKNLSWELYEKAMANEEINGVKQSFIEHFTGVKGDSETARLRLYMIVSMVGAVCYNSIVLETPFGIDSVKPELYRSIERILS
jgi:Transcriptional regulator